MADKEFFYVNVNKDLDVESWACKNGEVALNLASRQDDRHCAWLTSSQARDLAAALLRLADEADGK